MSQDEPMTSASGYPVAVYQIGLENAHFQADWAAMTTEQKRVKVRYLRWVEQRSQAAGSQ